MKRFLVALCGLFALVSLNSCGYNTMVSQDENVKGKWAQVENAYQRRADLVPNLVNTVKGAAKHEESTLTAVVEARAKATSVTINADDLSEENIAKFQKVQDEFSGSLSRLLASVEAYPDLKANQNFLELQAQLEGTENRISTERRSYNEAVQQYNTTVRSFPNNLMAGMFGFKAKGTFTAAPGSDKAPTVSF
ncbi:MULTISPECIES: LemA family protein [Sphingobacterium]|uniref:LemA family protein n=3 Tax=Sphingobacterium TaxID=28453 RepID=A0ACD5C9I3_9SPHI|nr:MULTISPECIES: LemA family protein [Sphingobacterium]APU99533.1 LemA family protein [Sphingobacterium sp. B29]KKO91926.1 LemA family protein [Sphingobacterium sp. Ag1]MBB1644582.1 LemA family protein [Sphingobacterium sp. UME9]MDR3009814.1 LemA family protein [Sphingobacterium sp.]OFV20213.1 LemA family protein [Sphingobacterium sp. HMSC13C05]